jgi:hypothetical protein
LKARIEALEARAGPAAASAAKPSRKGAAGGATAQ